MAGTKKRRYGNAIDRSAGMSNGSITWKDERFLSLDVGSAERVDLGARPQLGLAAVLLGGHGNLIFF